MCVTLVSALAALVGGLGTSSARADEIVRSCGVAGNEVFQHHAVFGINTEQTCPIGAYPQDPGFAITTAGNTVAKGQSGYWIATAPPGLTISDATIPSIKAPNVNGTSQYGGGFFWGPSDSDGGIYNAFSANASYGPDVGNPQPGLPGSQTFGFQLVCGRSPCTSNSAYAFISEVDLRVAESSGPSLTAGGLWGRGGWVRGDWPITASGDSASGVCSLSASVQGQLVAERSVSQDTSAWHQCNAAGLGGLAGTVHTTQFPNGDDTLSVSDSDAAGHSASSSETIHIDNQTPTVSLSGPTDALSTAGTQEVTATVGAGPSGAAGVACSVDGGANMFYPGTTAQVAVSGIGAHVVACVGESNAMSMNGQLATSASQSFNLTIRQPTAEAITFSHIADHLRCRTVTRVVKVRARRHVVRRHGRKVVVRGRVRHIKRKVRRCHARTVRRRVYGVLKRHGKPVRRHGHIVRVHRIRRVVVLPHRVYKTTRRIGHGRHTTVSGFLGLSDGTALPGRTVTVFGAPNDGDPQFAPVSSATTNADGVWVAKIPAGPSRLLEASYGGDATTEPATSTTVSLRVPAKIDLAISPRILPWRNAIHIRGHLVGGDVPHDGVALRLLVRYPHGRRRTPLLALRTNRRGGFSFTWSYHAGRDVARYPFAIATTATESDYPYAAGSSRALSVTFGKPTPKHRHHRRRHHRGRRRHAHRRRNHR